MGWPSGLRRWFKAPVGNVVGSNPTLIKFFEIMRTQFLPFLSECAFLAPFFSSKLIYLVPEFLVLAA